MSGFQRDRLKYPSHPSTHGGSGFIISQQNHGANYYFAKMASGRIPVNAVYVGTDTGGGKLYAGRAYHEGDLIPAKVAPNHGGAFVAWGGAEHSKFEYEVLQTTQAAWKCADHGNVPPQALVFGQTRQGENLFMGRTIHNGVLMPGKVQKSHGCLYISYGGKEIPYKEYEVLILIP